MSNAAPLNPLVIGAEDKSRKLPSADIAIRAEHEALLQLLGQRSDLQARMKTLAAPVPASKGGRRKTVVPSMPEVSIWSAGVRDLTPGNGGELLRQGSTAEPETKDKSPGAKATQDESPYLSQGVFPTAGLALSGGGIRSAAFCTGALQALEQNKVFGLVDYLSTVSGGGYIGSTVTLNLANGKGFALLKGGDEKKDAEALKTVRNNANFLKLGSISGMLKSAAIYLRGLIVNVVIVSAILFALAALTLVSNGTYENLQTPDIFGWELPAGWAALGAAAVTLACLLVYLLFNIGWANVLAFWPARSAGIAGKVLWLPAALLGVISVTAFLEFQPLVISKMFSRVSAPVTACASGALEVQCTGPDGQVLPAGVTCPQSRLVYGCKVAEVAKAASAGTQGIGTAQTYFSEQFSNLVGWFQGLLAPLLAVFGFAASAFGNLMKGEEVQNTWASLLKRNLRRLVILAAALTFLLGMWLVYLTLVYWGVDIRGETEIQRDLPAGVEGLFAMWSNLSGSRHVGLLYALIALVLYVLQANLLPNTNSLHRLYRDRLGNAFCFIQNESSPEDASGTKLSSLKAVRPIPIINAALNLQNSPVVKSKGRKADFFCFTPYSIGSDATGFASTAEFEKLKDGGEDLDIASAIAISGAAASSNMGSQSMRPLAPLLAFLNIRLGYWLPNPKRLISQSRLKPNLWYFINEALGRLNENRDTVYLTDGGHIENLGIYELLRRRCRLIIAVDAEADPKLTFGSFVTLQRHARIDLGVRIDLPWKELAAVSLEAMTGKAAPKRGPHCAIGKIEYDNGGHGILVYVKSTVTGDENDYIS
jgi:predicted acylesterase/phospholipase RssA